MTPRPMIRLGLLLLVVGAAGYLALRTGSTADPTALAGALRQVRSAPGASLGFILGYAGVTAIGFPLTPLILAGGAIFGFGRGFAFNWIAAVLGATLAYGIARALGWGPVRRLVGERAEVLDRISAEHGFLSVFRLRLIPVVPFIALNYGSGMVGVKLRDYVLATALGIAPVVAVYTYFADALVAGVAGARERAVTHVAIAAALLIGLSLVPTLARRLGLAGLTGEDEAGG